MAYANPWSHTIPPGTADANTLDTIIQQVRLDVEQRMDTLIGSSGDMNDDPVIDGVNALDLTALTTLANSKTTLAGLTTDQLIKATSAGTVGNAGVTATTLAAMATAPTSNQFGAVPYTLQIGPVGTYLITVGINIPSAAADVQFSIVSGSGFLPATGTNAHHVDIGTNNIITFLMIISAVSPGPNASLHVALSTGSIGGNSSILVKRLL
jgi:hypothetical protein